MTVDEIVQMYEKHTETIFSSLWRLDTSTSNWAYFVLLVALLGSVGWTLRPRLPACFAWPYKWPCLVCWSTGFVSFLTLLVAFLVLVQMSVPVFFPYSQDGLEGVLKEMFGNHTLYSVRGKERCIAAAVAKRQNPPDRSDLEIFDTYKMTFDNYDNLHKRPHPQRPAAKHCPPKQDCLHDHPHLSHICYDVPDGTCEAIQIDWDWDRTGDKNERRRSPKIVEVLKASTCAPIYFEAPTNIKDVDYIDGGVGGNCPLAQAIPRMKYLIRQTEKSMHLKTVLSIAPPRVTDTKGKKSSWEWMFWFTNQLVDGHRVYQDQVKANSESTVFHQTSTESTVFHRLEPKSLRTKAFKMDTWDTTGMKESMRWDN